MGLTRILSWRTRCTAHARVFGDSDSAVFREKCRPANRGTLPRGPRISGHGGGAFAALRLFVDSIYIPYLPFNIESYVSIKELVKLNRNRKKITSVGIFALLIHQHMYKCLAGGKKTLAPEQSALPAHRLFHVID